MSVVAAALLCIFVPAAPCGESVNLDELIADYGKATDVQRNQIIEAQKLKPISVSGTVENVEDWNTFDERTDTAAHYYKVVTAPQMTSAKTPYIALIFYKDKAKVAALARGQKVAVNGVLMKVVDEMGSFSVWVFGDELTAEDKVMLEI